MGNQSDEFAGFRKRKDYLVCVDSDGCAIDSMDCKHILCFGPCLVAEWELESYRDRILQRWNEINLYTMTRGINRFQGLAVMLREIHEQMTPIEGLDALLMWVEQTDELSNSALECAIRMNAEKETGKTSGEELCICLEKALSWSNSVNRAIRELPKETIQPFYGVGDALAHIHKTCDVAIVSSANYEAVMEEWKRFGLLEHVDIVMAQNAGTKKSCIEKLLSFGYARENVMMAGDAPGDREAAKANGVFYYPILVHREAQCWVNSGKALERLQSGRYAGEFEDTLNRAFVENLSQK